MRALARPQEELEAPSVAGLLGAPAARGQRRPTLSPGRRWQDGSPGLAGGGLASSRPSAEPLCGVHVTVSHTRPHTGWTELRHDAQAVSNSKATTERVGTEAGIDLDRGKEACPPREGGGSTREGGASTFHSDSGGHVAR